MPYPLIAETLIKGTFTTLMATESKSRLGTYTTTTVTGEPVQAFIPPKLPPNPPVGLVLGTPSSASVFL
jgi:hypothetical protein